MSRLARGRSDPSGSGGWCLGWFDGAVEVLSSLERRPFFYMNADQSEFVMAPHIGESATVGFFQCRARRCQKKDQSEFLKERGTVRAFVGEM